MRRAASEGLRNGSTRPALATAPIILFLLAATFLGIVFPWNLTVRERILCGQVRCEARTAKRFPPAPI